MSGQDITTAGMDTVPESGQRLPVPSRLRKPAVIVRPLDPKKSMAELRNDHFKEAGQLESERATWFAQWTEQAAFILPQRFRGFISDTNKGIKRMAKIRDSKATRCIGTSAAGMMTGMTSPARPWFEYGPADPALKGNMKVRKVLSQVTEIVRELFLSSNLYNELPTVYEDLLTFCTSSMSMEADPENVFHFNVFPVGSYSLGTDRKGTVDRFVRKALFTPWQMVEQFGANNVSPNVLSMYKNKQVMTTVPAWWYCGPNPNYDPTAGVIDASRKRYISAWWEIGATDAKPLQITGYDDFPMLSPRWQVTGEDVYGTGPGMLILPDVKELQSWVTKESRARDKGIDPALQVPSGLRQKGVGMDPGDETVVSAPNLEIKAIHKLEFNFEQCALKIQALHTAIEEGTFQALFQAITNDERQQPMTARETQERSEEKLTALGPVLNQLNTDLLKPLVERAFKMAHAAGKFAHLQWPDELTGKGLKVNFVSILAQAQKLTEVVAIDKTTDYASKVSASTQDISIWDNFDIDQTAVTYAELNGAPPSMIADPDVRDSKRQQRAAQQKAQAQAAQAAQNAQNAKNLASADTSGKNALTDITGGPVPGQAPWAQAA